eukprot:3582252-Rhodomonas_salina.1
MWTGTLSWYKQSKWPVDVAGYQEYRSTGTRKTSKIHGSNSNNFENVFFVVLLPAVVLAFLILRLLPGNSSCSTHGGIVAVVRET